MWRFVDLFLVTINCLERLVSEMAYCVQWDVKPYALTHCFVWIHPRYFLLLRAIYGAHISRETSWNFVWTYRAYYYDTHHVNDFYCQVELCAHLSHWLVAIPCRLRPVDYRIIQHAITALLLRKLAPRSLPPLHRASHAVSIILSTVWRVDTAFFSRV